MSEGNINESYIFVKGYGGEDKNISIKNAGNNWTEFIIKDINVTNGKCQVGIYTDGKAASLIKVDDFSLIIQ